MEQGGLTKRQGLRETIRKKEYQIMLLENEVIDLKRKDYLLCDEDQWYEENLEYISETKEDVKVGRIHWKEKFRDEDTGNFILVERSRIVKVNDIWRKIK